MVNKSNFKAFIVVLSMISTAVFSGEVLAGSMQFTVNGMVCAFCAQGIEKKLKAMPETAVVYINLAQKIVVVESRKDAVLPVDKIVQEIKEAGYDVSKTESSEKSVDDIRKEINAANKK